MQLKKLVLGGVVLTLVAGTGSVAEARDGGRWKKIPVLFQPVDIVEEDAGYACDAVGQCVAQSRITSAGETGDLEGTVVQGDTLGLGITNVVPINSTGAYAGSIKGCGSGTFLYDGRGRYDVATGEFKADYPIVPGTGTGDFEGLTGVFHTTSSPSNPTPPLDGWVRCKVRA